MTRTAEYLVLWLACGVATVGLVLVGAPGAYYIAIPLALALGYVAFRPEADDQADEPVQVEDLADDLPPDLVHVASPSAEDAARKTADLLAANEAEILVLLSQGHTGREIAMRLAIGREQYEEVLRALFPRHDWGSEEAAEAWWTRKASLRLESQASAPGRRS